MANILNLPNAKFEQCWRNSPSENDVRPFDLTEGLNCFIHESSPPVPADVEPLSPPVPVSFLSSSRLCVRNATVLSCTRLAVASMAYHELKHYHGLRNHSAKFIASTTIKVVSAAFKKINSVLNTLSPTKEKSEVPAPIVPTFANISHFQSSNSTNVVSNNYPHNFPSEPELILGNALRYPPSRGKTN